MQRYSPLKMVYKGIHFQKRSESRQSTAFGTPHPIHTKERGNGFDFETPSLSMAISFFSASIFVFLNTAALYAYYELSK